jgi:hypothetical protein
MPWSGRRTGEPGQQAGTTTALGADQAQQHHEAAWALREYLLVTEFFADAVELGEAEVTDQVIDDGLQIIRKLWEAGLAHRDIKPPNLTCPDPTRGCLKSPYDPAAV